MGYMIELAPGVPVPMEVVSATHDLQGVLIRNRLVDKHSDLITATETLMSGATGSE